MLQHVVISLIPVWLLVVCIPNSTWLRKGMFCFPTECLWQQRNFIKQECWLISANAVDAVRILIFLLCCDRIMQIVCNAMSNCTGESIEGLDPLCIFKNNKIVLCNLIKWIAGGHFLARMYQICNLSYCWNRILLLKFSRQRKNFPVAQKWRE